MSWNPDMKLLRGVTQDQAECFGKPHLGAFYRISGFSDTRSARLAAAHSNQLMEDARCVCCGRPATNAHHWPPLRVAAAWEHPKGVRLRPALFAVCGSGTTGCHDGFHGGARFKALWRWDSDEFKREWWLGSMLEDLGAHSPALFEFGCWEFYDFETGRIWQVRL